jgi:hypothetical protein
VLERQAFAAILDELRLKLLGFRVAAPSASQGAALEENDGPDARTVVNGIFLDVKNSSCTLHFVSGLTPGSNRRSGEGRFSLAG